MLQNIANKLLILASLLCPLSGLADEFMPPDFTIEYALKKDNTVVGMMIRTLKHLDSDRFLFESSSKTTGFISLFYKNSIHESTAWHISENQFIAEEYHYLRNKKDKLRKVDIHFDWDKKKIITTVNDSSWSMPIEKPVYDKLLYQIAVMYDLSAGRPIHTYRIADGGRMKEYYFESAGNELLSKSIGDVKTVKIIRHKENKQDRIILWCAPDLYYLPVRVDTYEDDGSVITAYIKRIEGLNLGSIQPINDPGR